MYQVEDFPWSVAYLAYEHRPLPDADREKWLKELEGYLPEGTPDLLTCATDEAHAYRAVTDHLYTLYSRRDKPKPASSSEEERVALFVEQARKDNLHLRWLQWSRLRPGLRKYQAYQMTRFLRAVGLRLGILPPKWTTDPYVRPLLSENGWGPLKNLLVQMTSEGVRPETIEVAWQEKALELIEAGRSGIRGKIPNPYGRGGRPKGEP